MRRNRRRGGQTDVERIRQAFRALDAGGLEYATQIFDELAASAPSDPDVLHGAGLLALRLGDAARAQRLLQEAVRRRPDQAGMRCTLAIALRECGERAAAQAQLESALRLDANLAEAHAQLGRLQLESGRTAPAAECFERALALRPEHGDALNGLGLALSALGDHERACACFERAIAANPGLAHLHANLAASRVKRAVQLGDREPTAGPQAARQMGLALDSLAQALRSAPDHAPYWTQFSECVRYFNLKHPLDAGLRQLLCGALEHQSVDPGDLVRPVTSLALDHPAAQALRRQLTPASVSAAQDWSALGPPTLEVLGEPLLLLLMELAVLRDVFLERLIELARRRALLDETGGPRADPPLPFGMLVAIAHQAFNTEYVYSESEEERSRLEALRGMLRVPCPAHDEQSLRRYALFACYCPLRELPEAAAIAQALGSGPLSGLARRQILEPLEEARLRERIVTLGEASSDVSRAVQAQYESNPYPRWLRVARAAEPGPFARGLREMFPEADLEGLADGAVRMLVAGCGTGQHPIATVQRFTDVRVLAVDLSRASLAYAMRKSSELGLQTIDYRQGDLLALGSLAERFDVIECSGVLHHLADPEGGWRVLRSLLRPRGLMRIGLYSEAARRHVARARELIAAEGFAPTAEGIRRCRAAIIARRDDALLAKLLHAEDFFSLSGCRDLLFHVQEHRFTLLRIAALLERLELRLLGFELADSGATAARYRARFPDDRAMCNLENWHRLEEQHPDTFARMYQFWVRSAV